jgi:hypothetical protein
MVHGVFLQRMTATLLVAVILAITLLLASQASAQVAGVTLSGIITDGSGAAIVNAQVAMTNQAPGVTRDASVNSAGSSSAHNLLQAPYEVIVKAARFSTAKQSDPTPTVGAQQVLKMP